MAGNQGWVQKEKGHKKNLSVSTQTENSSGEVYKGLNFNNIFTEEYFYRQFTYVLELSKHLIGKYTEDVTSCWGNTYGQVKLINLMIRNSGDNGKWWVSMIIWKCHIKNRSPDFQRLENRIYT